MSGGLRPWWTLWCRGDLKERLCEDLAGPWLQAARGRLGQPWSSPQPSSLWPGFRLFWKQPPGLWPRLHYESSSTLSRIPFLPQSLSPDARLQRYGVMSEGVPATTSSSPNSLPLGVGLSWASSSACSAIQQLKDHSQVPSSPCASVYRSVHQESNRGASPCLNQDCIQLGALECTLCPQEGTAREAWLGYFQGIY